MPTDFVFLEENKKSGQRTNLSIFTKHLSLHVGLELCGEDKGKSDVSENEIKIHFQCFL